MLVDGLGGLGSDAGGEVRDGSGDLGVEPPDLLEEGRGGLDGLRGDLGGVGLDDGGSGDGVHDVVLHRMLGRFPLFSGVCGIKKIRQSFLSHLSLL